MDDLIKLVRTYRVADGLAERLRLAEQIFKLIEPDLRLFVFGSVRRDAAQDVLQETLKAVAVGLKKFEGATKGEFWAWCYRIARNKLNDQFRKQGSDKIQVMPPDELLRLVDASGAGSPISAADRHDLDYAMQLLKAAKPECYEFLWKRFILGFDYSEIAEEKNLQYDAVRMRVGRCLDDARALVA